tara:strand:+ start:669 stop:845 length:177 start_codon:yes stop_codon:yes gene_type:complete
VKSQQLWEVLCLDDDDASHKYTVTMARLAMKNLLKAAEIHPLASKNFVQHNLLYKNKA